ncbi:MAG: hypothetical protein IIT55_01965 [Bacteroidaceae bacterium]|nr:hypothetical protein [Bacteroidaceae bacterium]
MNIWNGVGNGIFQCLADALQYHIYAVGILTTKQQHACIFHGILRSEQDYYAVTCLRSYEAGMERIDREDTKGIHYAYMYRVNQVGTIHLQNLGCTFTQLRAEAQCIG